MSPHEILTQIFDRAMTDGMESLLIEEQELFLIQDFIIEIEMGGLAGYFYNRLPVPERIRSTVAAMRKYAMIPLSEFLGEALVLFGEFSKANISGTWNDVLRHCDLDGKLREIEKKIYSLDDYGLEKSTIK